MELHYLFFGMQSDFRRDWQFLFSISKYGFHLDVFVESIMFARNLEDNIELMEEHQTLR
jgi:hypothetical protein